MHLAQELALGAVEKEMVSRQQVQCTRLTRQLPPGGQGFPADQVILPPAKDRDRTGQWSSSCAVVVGSTQGKIRLQPRPAPGQHLLVGRGSQVSQIRHELWHICNRRAGISQVRRSTAGDEQVPGDASEAILQVVCYLKAQQRSQAVTKQSKGLPLL